MNASATPLRALIRAAAAAVREQAGALRNHPNAALYAAIGRLIPGAGHYLELDPCLVCLEHKRSESGEGDGRKGDSSSGGSGGGGGASGAASVSAAAVAMLGSGSIPAGVILGAPAPGGSAGAAAAAGSGGGLVFWNYSLDSVKAASKSTENAMLVRLLIIVTAFVVWSVPRGFRFHIHLSFLVWALGFRCHHGVLLHERLQEDPALIQQPFAFVD